MDYTLDQIRKSFNPQTVEDSFLVWYIFRPISVYLTYVMLRINVTANQATILGLFFGLAGMGFFMTGQKFLFWPGLLFYLLYKTFDYVDGNIARVTDSATYYGKFLDGAVDTVIDTVLPFAIGWGFYVAHKNSLFLFASFGASMAVFFSFFLINRLSFYTRWIKMDEKQSISKQVKNINPLKSAKIPLRKIQNLVIDIEILIIVIASVTGMSNLLLTVFLMLITGWAVTLIITTLQSAFEQINIHRISRSDSRICKNI